MKSIKIQIRVNDKTHTLSVPANWTLLDVLREKLGLTGTKRGCEIGECGACTVVMNGRAVNSCLILAAQADGADILTVEGLSQNGKLHPLQDAFLRHDAVHCGFCTPGMLMSAYALLQRNPAPSPEEIRQAIAGNLCRCSGYQQIVEAVEDASRNYTSG